MDAPQSAADVEPIERAIREQVWGELCLCWNPRSVVTRPGGFDPYGRPVPPKLEGRWEVGFWRRVDGEREPRWISIYQVCYDGEGKSAYRAVGWWLVDFLKKWDRANAHWQAEQAALAEEEEALRAAADLQAKLELQESLEKKGRDELKMKVWLGGGFGKGPRRHVEHSNAEHAA